MQLRKKEIKELNEELDGNYTIDKKSKVEKEENIIRVDGEVLFFYYENTLLPTLKLLQKNNFLPKVVVDMPAVPFMIKGADVMRPGIKDLETFEKDDYIAIVDENNQKPLAIGKALLSSEDMKAVEKGRVIENIHYVGDELWNS